MQEPSPALIESHYLAEPMAYAEQPYRDRILEIRQSGIDDQGDIEAALLRTAETTARRAGVELIDSFSRQLGTATILRTVEHGFVDIADFPPDVDPQDKLDPPVLGNPVIGEASAAKIIATLVTLPSEERNQKTVVDRTSLSLGTVSSLFTDMVDKGFITKKVEATGKMGRPVALLEPTEQLNEHINRVPSWNTAVRFKLMCEKLGKSETETMAYLLRAGQAALIDESVLSV